MCNIERHGTDSKRHERSRKLHAHVRLSGEPNGDIVLHKRLNLEIIRGKDTPRFLNLLGPGSRRYGAEIRGL